MRLNVDVEVPDKELSSIAQRQIRALQRENGRLRAENYKLREMRKKAKDIAVILRRLRPAVGDAWQRARFWR